MSVESVLNDIKKKYGNGAIRRLGDSPLEVEAISTGSLSLDIASGIGGFPKGRIIEIYGPESSGKTTLALHCIAKAQLGGGTAAFIDAEHAFDPAYARSIGIDTDSLLLSQPDSGEEALDIAEMLIKASAVQVLVIDSVAALVPQAEINGEMGDSKMGLQARLMSQAMRKLAGPISKSGAVVIFINQIREKIGVMFGNPETTSGGNALKFYASIRIDVRKSGAAQKNKDGVSIATKVKAKFVKNKVAPPFTIAEFDICYGIGIDRTAEVIDLGVECDLVEKAGSWYSVEGTKIGQGKLAAQEFLNDNPELLEELYEKIANHYLGV